MMKIIKLGTLACLAAGDKSTDPIDMVRFPNQNTIANCLRNHQDTNSQVLADPRFIEAMASAFADKKIPFNSVDDKVIAVVRNWQWHRQMDIPIHVGKSITNNFRETVLDCRSDSLYDWETYHPKW